MSQISFEQVLTDIRSWPPEKIAELRAVLETAESERRTEVRQETRPESRNDNSALRAAAREASMRDFSAERRWLADHRDEYAGQWVALKGSQLICNSFDHKEVFAAADAAGSLETLVVLVEARSKQPTINLG